MIRIGLLSCQTRGEVKTLDKRAVYDVVGAPVHLTELLKTGDEGEIFLIDGTPGYCAKVFNEKRCTTTLFQKILAMVAHPPDAGLINRREVHGSAVLAWPCSVLFDSPLGSRSFIGYMMPLVDTDFFREAHGYYDPQERIQLFGNTFSWRYLLTAAYHIAAVTDDIHRHGHCFGDFSERTILIAPTAAVAVIHCDSFQIRDSISGRIFPSSAGTGENLPPELQDRPLPEGRVDWYYGDLFGLAVMVFRLFMNGMHPFKAERKGVSVYPEIEQKIQNGVFAFATPDQYIHSPSFAPDYRIIPLSLRRLFYRCFVDGIVEPKRRPSAGEWKDCLHAEILAMKHCRVDGKHWFGGHLLACPWCNPGAEDIFPDESHLSIGDEPIVAETNFPSEERALSFPPVSPSTSVSPLLPYHQTPPPVAESVVEDSDVSGCEVLVSEMSGFGEVIPDTPDSTPGILLPEPHVTMHNLSRGITIPVRLPVTVTGNGSLLIHITSDARWIEIANTVVTVEGKGGIHVTLNTGNMNNKGFQKGRVLLQAGDIQEEIFLFVSLMPEL